VTYISAIYRGAAGRDAARRALFIIGEDVGVEGGVFKATKGLYEEFGRGSVIDSPLAEA